MDVRPGRRPSSNMNTTKMFRDLHGEAPLGQLLGKLPGAAQKTPFETLSVQSRGSPGQWHLGGRDRCTPQHSELSRGDWRFGRRASTQSSTHRRRPAEEPEQDNRSAAGVSQHSRPGPSFSKTMPPGSKMLQTPKLLPDVLSRRAQDSPSSKGSRPASRLGSRVTMLSGTSSEANARYRAYMEDRTNIVDPFMAGDAEGDQWGYYAVYDGHGGSDAVDYVELNLHDVIFKELKCANRTHSMGEAVISQALHRSFTQVDTQLKSVGAWKCGCTATVGLVHKSAAGLQLYLANVGDSSALVIDSIFQGHRISFDHRPTDPKETVRVEAEGGFVARGRVNGQLGVSRALGDHYLKTAGVTGSPHVAMRDVTSDVALVIASDGLWDVLQPVDVTRLFEQNVKMRSPDGMADLLVAEALRCGSTDNISCVVCFLASATKAL